MKKILLLFLLLCLPFINTKALDIEELDNLEENIAELNKQLDTFETNRLNQMYPVGSIFETTNYSTTSQVQNALGGTWEIYGAGRILVGINTDDSNFNTAGKTGGVSSITLSTANIPSHTHSIPVLSGTAASAGSHSHNVRAYLDQTGYGATIPANTSYFLSTAIRHSGTTAISKQNFMQGTTATSAGAHTHTVTTTANTTGNIGSGSSFTNIQPSIAIYRYKRIS